jgi:hypothetical protein
MIGEKAADMILQHGGNGTRDTPPHPVSAGLDVPPATRDPQPRKPGERTDV